MSTIDDKDEKLEKKEKEGLKKLEEGYKHLMTFEAKKGGYEWFGADPGHEALSAYGLM